MTSKNPFAAVFDTYNFDVAVLEPAQSESDEIKIRLVSNPRTDIGYECISYDRSKDYGSAKITLDGEETEIPVPLEQALRTIRKKDQPRHVWADLLLGRTNEQQTKQARLRNEILQNAKCTIAWLGPAGTSTPLAFKVMRTLAQWWLQGEVRCDFPAIFVRATNQQMIAMVEFLATQDISTISPHNLLVWEDLQSVFTSSYFDAVQTIPDLIMSSNARITRGSSSVALSDFMAAFKCAPMVLGQLLKRPPGPEFADALAKIGGISIADTRWREGQHLELLPMIQTAAEAKTVDSREYVFAMLPLSKPSKRLEGTGRSVAPLTIDYSLTTEQVFQEAAKFIIDERQDLLLWWAERPPVGRKIFNMPSWVPDWTSKLPGGIAGPIKLSCEAQPSLRQWSDSIQPQKRITIEDNKLHLQAHKLDRIQTISRLFTYDNCRKLLVEQWKALPWGPSETTDKKAERFWRTIVLNVGGETNSPSTQAPPPRSLTASFLSIVAEERVLELLGCTMEQLGTDEAIRERARTHPECKAIGHQCGKGEAFEVLMRKNAIGRRFFTTESGGLGMTAFEEVNSTLKAARDALQAQAADTQGFGGMMMSSFQNFLKERDPAGAEAYAKAMGETEDERGAKVGDVIVAAVGGFHPYVLRQAGEDAESSTDSLRGKEFTYIGDCYLHGVMKGEPFAATNWLGRQSWRTDITVEDIRIV